MIVTLSDFKLHRSYDGCNVTRDCACAVQLGISCDVDICDIDACEHPSGEDRCWTLDECYVDYSACEITDKCTYDCPCGTDDTGGNGECGTDDTGSQPCPPVG